MAYDNAGNIISDAAAELGLGTVADAYGSIDANVIQLRGLLKSAGQKLITERDWTHLTKEFSFVTYPAWVKSTIYTALALAWGNNTAYSVNDYVFYALDGATNLYQCTTAGTSVLGGVGPIFTSGSGTDGTVTWKFLNSGKANIVTKGLYAYTCTTGGTSGTVGPTRTAATQSDGTVIWTYLGRAADFALPSDFSNMVDQTGWNRTNRLPVGGPVDGQVWQYLKGRQQGVVFNVLFRTTAGLLRIYPDTDPPAGYAITFEYQSNSWVSVAGGTVPTTNAPTANSDVIYFDRLMMVRKLKLLWLRAKGFDTSYAKEEYEDTFEEVANADGSAPTLNLGGPGVWDPLIGAQNVPPSGFGS